ncbi:MAG: glycosyl hydrolase [Bacteroidota bacterium]
MKSLNLLILLLLPFLSFAQQPPYTPAKERLAGFEVRKELNENSLVSNIEFTSVGPTVMSGRVADLAVNPNNPTEFYVAYAAGGLWKTENNGITFEPVFDNQAVLTMGDVAVDWERNIIWVGTGENNSSRSSYSGTGMYKSTDGGKTWSHLGLEESHHIGRIVLHPNDPNTAWVGVLGHLYSPNQERGLYKTTDGGATWNKTLFVDEDAGIIDVVVNPNAPNELYAASWERKRRAWNFWEGGANSKIFKSVDGGETWDVITDAERAFPTGEGVGRIGLDLYVDGDKTILYAFLDNQDRRPEDEKEEDDVLTKDDLRDMSKEDFLQLDEKQISKFISSNRFPDSDEFETSNIIAKVKDGSITPLTLVEYLENANAMLFDTPVIGGELYKSEDGGHSWTKTHEGFIDDFVYSYGYYFGEVRVADYDSDKVFIMGVPILRSDDGGKTFKSINGDNVHVDHHALWVNPNLKGHIINGNDGGVNISYDDGESWTKCNSPAVGTFYTVNYDMAKPYNIYGGLQDNGVWVGSSNYSASDRWHSSGRYPYQSIMGGDGMQIAVDTRDNNTVYTGYQFGNYFRINQATDQRTYITPSHKLGDRPYRWNWQTPIHLSIHNEDILYMGSNKFHRSMNQGDDFETLSDDLTKGGKKGDVAFGTLTSIHESPTRFGLVYVGSDDGLIHVTKDGGYTWKKISDNLPQDMWVSRVYASAHKESRVYIALNGYRWDKFTAMIYMSDNYGENWVSVANGLPAESVNVFKEDPNNEKVLYVGTDHALYVSINGGKSWMGMNQGLPDAPVHDLVVHPRESEIIIATHGRSIYTADVKHLQILHDSIVEKDFHLFAINKMRYRSNWGNTWSKWLEVQEPTVKFPVYLKSGGKVTTKIMSDDMELFSFDTDCRKGINYIEYHLELAPDIVKAYEEALNQDLKDGEDPITLEEAGNEKTYIYKGNYKIILEKDGKTLEGKLKISDK